MKIFEFLVIFIFAISVVNSCDNPILGCRPIVCPNTTFTGQTIEELKAFEKEVYMKLWNQQSIYFSPSALDLHNAIKDLFGWGTEAAFVRNYIFWVALLREFIEQKSITACPFEEAIYGSIRCRKDKDPSENANAYWARDLYMFAGNLILRNGIIKMRCGRNRIQIPKWDCPNNGFVYDVDYLWDTDTIFNLPPTIKNMVKILYNSDNYVDRYLAAIATFSISGNQMIPAMSKPLYFELLNFLNDSNVPRKCCLIVGSRLRELLREYIIDTSIAINDFENRYKTPGACN